MWHSRMAIPSSMGWCASGSTEQPDLAVRFSCFNANVCKECTMLIDGEVQYACIAKLQTGLIQLDPLPNVPRHAGPRDRHALAQGAVLMPEPCDSCRVAVAVKSA